MYDVVTNAAGNSGCSKPDASCGGWRLHPHSAVDIFVKDLGLVADTAKAPALPAAIGLNSIEYVHQRQ